MVPASLKVARQSAKLAAASFSTAAAATSTATTAAERHNAQVRAEFSRQAADGFDLRWQVRGNPAAVPGWVLGQLEGWITQQTEVLDVACGTGLLGRGLAPLVRSVVGIDTTPAMLAQAAEAASSDGAGNTSWQLGEAEALPFEDGSFDLVACRLAVRNACGFRTTHDENSDATAAFES